MKINFVDPGVRALMACLKALEGSGWVKEVEHMTFFSPSIPRLVGIRNLVPGPIRAINVFHTREKPKKEYYFSLWEKNAQGTMDETISKPFRIANGKLSFTKSTLLNTWKCLKEAEERLRLFDEEDIACEFIESDTPVIKDLGDIKIRMERYPMLEEGTFYRFRIENQEHPLPLYSEPFCLLPEPMI